MNIFNIINRGASYANILGERRHAARYKERFDALEKARSEWLNALLVDETRTWMAVGSVDKETISGMTTMLTLAGMVHVYDENNTDTPDLSIIRGAISAAEQCGKVGGMVSKADAQAFSSACSRAQVIVKNATHLAIEHAALELRQLVGIANDPD